MANILVFGSSTTLGFNDFKEGGWVDRLKKFVNEINEKEKLSHAVYNLGVDGDDTQGLLKRFLTEAKPRCWPNSKNIIIFEIGTNDSIVNADKSRRTPPEKFGENLKKIISQSKKLTKYVTFVSLNPVIEERLTPVPWSPNESYYEAEVERYDNIIKKVCKQKGVDFIDLFKETSKYAFKKYIDDGVHPNPKGHEIIFKTVKNFLEEKKYI